MSAKLVQDQWSQDQHLYDSFFAIDIAPDTKNAIGA